MSRRSRYTRTATIGTAAALAALPSTAGAAGPAVKGLTLDPIQVVIPTHGYQVPRKPDLVVSRADQYQFTVKNVGFVSAGRSWASVTTDRLHLVPKLAPGQSVTFPIRACDLDSWGPMVIQVDTFKQVDELSETNNTATVRPLC